MFTRFFLFYFVLFVFDTFSCAAETYFEVIDSEANSVVGTIVSLDRTYAVVDVQGESLTIPLETVVKIRNLSSSPYEEAPFMTGYQNLVQIPAPMVRTARGASERNLDEVKAKIQESSGQAVKKTLPGSVVALELKDGSRLTASSFTLTNGQGICRLLEQQNDLLIPLDYLSAVRFDVRNLGEVANPPADWLRLAIPSTEGDRLIVGHSGSFDVYAGILHDVNAEIIAFEVDGEVLPVPRRKVFGFVLHGEPVPPASALPLAVVSLWSGTRGMVSDIQWKGDELTWTTVAGLTVCVPLPMVDEIDFGEKGTVYLFGFEQIGNEFSFPFASDTGLEPLKLVQTFYESRTKAAREIMLDGISYERGITVFGRSSLEYRLPKPFAVLKGIVGIEDQYRPYASAMLQILADSQVLGTWELRGDAAAQQILLNLPQNCRLLKFVAEPLPLSEVPTVLTIVEPKLFE